MITLEPKAFVDELTQAAEIIFMMGFYCGFTLAIFVAIFIYIKYGIKEQ